MSPPSLRRRRHRRRLQHGAGPRPARARLDLHRAGGCARGAGRRRHLPARGRRGRRDGLRAASPSSWASGPAPGGPAHMGIPALLDAAALITTGQCDVVLIAAGGAGVHTDRSLDRPLDAAGQRARRRLRAVHRGRVRAHGAAPHAHLRHHARADGRRGGRDPHQRPRQPRSRLRRTRAVLPADILASRMVADPFHLLDCATTSEGGCAIVLTSAERAGRLRGARVDPRWCQRLLRARPTSSPRCGTSSPAPRLLPAGLVGARAARIAFAMAGLTPGRRRRRRALRSLLVRDHPAARGLRLLRAR